MNQYHLFSPFTVTSPTSNLLTHLQAWRETGREIDEPQAIHMQTGIRGMIFLLICQPKASGGS